LISLCKVARIAYTLNFWKAKACNILCRLVVCSCINRSVLRALNLQKAAISDSSLVAAFLS